jgi:hypothetical protein
MPDSSSRYSVAYPIDENRDIRILQSHNGVKAVLAVELGVNAIQKERMEMNVEIKSTSKALNESDASRFRTKDPFLSCGAPSRG